MSEYTEALTRQLLAEALKGYIQSLRFCLERLIPVCRERPVGVRGPRDLYQRGCRTGIRTGVERMEQANAHLEKRR